MELNRKRYELEQGLIITHKPNKKYKWEVNATSTNQNIEKFLKHFKAYKKQYKTKIELLAEINNYLKTQESIKLKHLESTYQYKNQTVYYTDATKEWYYIKEGKPQITNNQEKIKEDIDKEINPNQEKYQYNLQNKIISLLTKKVI